MDGDEDGPLVSHVDGDAWVCVFCAHRNDLGADRCASCRLSFAGGRSAAVETRTRPTVRDALTRTLHPAAETGLAVLMFAFWRLADVVAGTRGGGAVGRGRDEWTFERRLHLPSEASLQHLLSGSRTADRIMDAYYAVGHAPGMAVLAAWLLWRHRDSYGLWRTRVVAATAVSFAVQAAVTVAPPRLVPGIGVADTARALGESVYSSHGRGYADQVAALPSVHVAWAVLVCLAVLGVSRSRWRRAVVAHPVVTVVVVVATGNHYWLDCVAGATAAAATLLVRRPPTVPDVFPEETVGECPRTA